MTYLMGLKGDFSWVWYKLPWLGRTGEPEEPWAALGAPSCCYLAFPVLKHLFQAVSGVVPRPAMAVVKGAALLAFRLKELWVRHK